MDELSRNILRKSGRRLLFRPLPGLLLRWLPARLSGPRLRSYPGLHPGLHPGLLLRLRLRSLPRSPLRSASPLASPVLVSARVSAGSPPASRPASPSVPPPASLPAPLLAGARCRRAPAADLAGGLGCRLGRPSSVPDSPGDSSVRGLFCSKGPMAPARRAGLSAEGECGRHAKAKNSVFCFYFLIKDVSLCSQNNTLSE